MKSDKKFKRQCCSCRQIKEKYELIRITKDFETGGIFINTDNKIHGRSVYICKNIECLENSLKRKRIENSLKAVLPENIKQELYTVLTS
ncbi:MAG: YlxR family protein [Candidatus Avigastranaerophilus sp.]